jgi:hypothetical protein
MARGYIIEEVRAANWTMRLRDSVSGEIVEVPLVPGERFSPPSAGKNGAANDDSSPPVQPTPDSRSGESAPEPDDASEDDAVEEGDKADEHPARQRRKKKGPRANKKTAQRREAPEAPPQSPAAKAAADNPLETPEGRVRPVDISTLTVDDQAAMKKLGGMLRRALRRGKVGELGWQETTEAGRSGLFARWGKGQFKLLHAGNDNYALFYEWDGGKWERIGCGAADELMKLAEARAESEIPGPPLTTINLEFARLLCGTPEQKAAAKERLEPVFQEVDTRTRHARRAARATTPASPADASPPSAPQADDVAEDPALDDKIVGSLKSVLEDVE